MKKENYVFTQDNGDVNRDTVYANKKLTVSIPKDRAEYLLKSATNWHTSTKSHASIVERFARQSSSVYDSIILKLYMMGYGK